jgi:hypothetical protein
MSYIYSWNNDSVDNKLEPCSSSFDTVYAMRQQEEAKYRKHDPLHQEVLDDSKICHRVPLQNIDIDEVCRDKMCEWSYQIVDFCKFSRESVDVAMNYLDRFLRTTSGLGALQDRNVYQLAAMTALYSAIKILERQALSPKVVSQLSRGIYTEEQITQMESVILIALEWKLHPPTAFSFVRELLAALPNHFLDEPTKEKILEIAQVQTELAVCDYRFIETPASTVAYCAIMNALECCGYNCQKTKELGAILATATGLQDGQCLSVIEAQIALYSVCPMDVVIQDDSSSFMSDDSDQHLKKDQNADRYGRRASLEESPRSTAVSNSVAFS